MARDLDLDETFKPLLLDPAVAGDARKIAELRSGGRVAVHDRIEAQLRDLVKVRSPTKAPTEAEVEASIAGILGGRSRDEHGRWAYFPWSRRLVHILPQGEFREVRLDRNRNKITSEEQARLGGAVVGIVGLSVGNAIAVTMALEGVCGALKLADFDRLDLSNMNRLRAGVHEIGIRKTVLAARQIHEFDPYFSVVHFGSGLSGSNIDDFMVGEPRLDVLIDECDGLAMKFLLRARARAHKIPVIMETSDRGMLDIERFDLEPERPLFHGLAPSITSEELAALTTETKVRVVMGIVGGGTMSARMGASMVEIERTTSTWPQLASDVALGGASATVAARKILLGEPLPSGRKFVDLQERSAGEDERSRGPEGAELPPALPPRGLAHEASGTLPASAALGFVVQQACLAPSGGNCQPWHFHHEGDTLWISLDAERARNLLDQRRRASLIALGAALENAVLAAASLDHDALVETFPLPRREAVVARLRLRPSASSGPIEDPSLQRQIARRVTNRRLASRAPLPVGASKALVAAASARGALLELVDRPEALAELGELLGQGDRIRFLCADLHREVVGELRWTDEQAESTRDGVDLATLEMSPADRVAMRLVARPDVAAVLRDQRGGSVLEEGSRRLLSGASAAGMLSLAGDDPSSWLEAGRAVQRVWLEATAQDLAFQPMTAILFMFELLDNPSIYRSHERDELARIDLRLRSLFPVTGPRTRAMLFRLAIAGEPTARALRLDPALLCTQGAPP